MDAHSSEVHPLFPKPLSIAKVIAPLTYKRAIVRAVEDLRLVEPIAVDPRTGSDEIEVEDRRNKLEDFRNTISSYLDAINPDIDPRDTITIGQSEADVIDFIRDVVENKAGRIGEIISRKEEIDNRLSELQSIMELLVKLETLNISDTSMLQDSRHVKTFMGTIFPGQMTRLSWEIDEITDSRYLMIDNKIDDESTLLSITVLKTDSEAIGDKLKTFSFNDVVIPNDLDLDGLSKSDCINEMADLEVEENQLNAELETLSQEVGHDILTAREVTNIELQRITVEQKMRRTKSTCVMWAWIPEELMDEFKTKMHSATDGTATYDFRRGQYDPDFTPSRVENSEFMEPMRGLVSAFGTPGLHEVDPYKFVAIMFPVLFGIMFADLGHGILLFLLGLYLKRKRDKMVEEPKGLSVFIYGGANLLIIMGAVSAVCGIMFNSFFGDETILWQVGIFKTLFEHTTWKFFFYTEGSSHLPAHVEIERNYVNFLVFSFAVGALVILLGLLLNIYQLYYYRHSQSEWYAGLTLFGTYFFVIVTVIAFLLTGMNQIVLISGLILVLACLLGTLIIEQRAHGIDGLMLGIDHILSLMSNTFSFGRLLAMNTIHFVLALLPYLFISLAGPEIQNHSIHHWLPWHEDPMLLVWWIIAAVIGSLIVVPVETTFSTLQSLRLNWVEFFGKFFKGNGVEFKPVKVKRLYSREN